MENKTRYRKAQPTNVFFKNYSEHRNIYKATIREAFCSFKYLSPIVRLLSDSLGHNCTSAVLIRVCKNLLSTNFLKSKC